MCSISDIPVVGKTLDKISDVIVEAGTRKLRYCFCYKSLVKDLYSEIKNVEIQEDRVTRKVDAEKSDGKIILDHVLKWQYEVVKIKNQIEVFSERYEQKRPWMCLKDVRFCHPVTRFRFGKEAAQKVKKVTKLIDSGKELIGNEIAYHPPCENVPISDGTIYWKFESRQDAYVKIWEALVKDDEFSRIGIYGMPGVGKTRMMEQAWKEVKEKGTFDKVIRVNVGNDQFDVMKIQEQIAGYLGCNLDLKINEDQRATQLMKSLKNGGKLLVIFDDVWSEIPFHKIGIPVGDGDSDCCKILLTSRMQDVCLHNSCKHLVEIKTLTVDEAWDMFKNSVGTSKIDSLQEVSLALKVCKECAGLPLLIVAVGKALKFMSEYSWKDALDQLQNCIIEDVPGMDREVYVCIKLSFDRLPKDAKSCLLLCSLFPEDAEIEINVLFEFAIGSQLLNSGRNRVHAMVEILKSASLLLAGDDDGKVKLHDSIRDVARSVAAKDPLYAFLFLRCSSRFPSNYDDHTCRLLHLYLDKETVQFQDDLVFPNLRTLWLECKWLERKYHEQQFSDSFFNVFLNLRFLVVRRLSFPLRFQAPHKLKILVMDHCQFDDISTIVSENLETLKVWECYFRHPINLPELKYLRKLELLSIFEILMVPNALSSLSSLEELHIPGGLRMWLGEERILANSYVEISAELSRLNSLKILKIRLKNSESCPEENVMKNLQEFNIAVGYSYEDEGRSYTSTKLANFFSTQLQGAGIAVVQRAEEVNLRDVKGLPDGLIISKSEVFADLRKLHIDECHNMDHLTTIPHGKMRPNSMVMCFTKLSILKISHCPRLIYLFCPSVAKCLVQLEELCIYACRTMENIIRYDDQIDEEIISFPQLKLLELNDVKKLTSFYGKKRELASTSTSMDNHAILCVQTQSLFDGMVALPSLEILRLCDLTNVQEIWKEEYRGNDSFHQLKILEVKHCTDLEVVIQPEILSRLQNLEKLHIKNCTNLKYVFLPSTKMLYGLQNLEELHIDNCNRLTYVLLTSTARDLVRLKQLNVSYCQNMKEIITTIRDGGKHDIDEKIMFPEMASLELTHLPHFIRFWNFEPRFWNVEPVEDDLLLAELPFIDISYSFESVEASRGKGQSYVAPKVSFPNLVALEFRGLRISLNDMELSSIDSKSNIISLKIHSHQELQLPLEWQLEDVETLHLANCWRDGLLKEIYPHGGFERLKVLRVHNYRLSTLFSYSVFRNFQQLEELEVQDCYQLEQIFENGESSDSNEIIVSLSRLTSIVFGNLPSLKDSGAKSIFACNLPALEVVKIRKCELSTLFTCTDFRNLQKLEELEVLECGLLEQIVADDQTSSTEEKTISLYFLKSVQLEILPKLQSFSSSPTYAFNFPALSSVELFGCPKMNHFTNLQVRTPLLHMSSSWNWGVSISDLNEYIRLENDEEMFTIALKNIFELDTGKD